MTEEKEIEIVTFSEMIATVLSDKDSMLKNNSLVSDLLKVLEKQTITVASIVVITSLFSRKVLEVVIEQLVILNKNSDKADVKKDVLNNFKNFLDLLDSSLVEEK